jgi:hypothetical protein
MYTYICVYVCAALTHRQQTPPAPRMRALLHIDELIRLHRGQGLDVYWRDNNICPTEEEYISMVIDSAYFWLFFTLSVVRHPLARDACVCSSLGISLANACFLYTLYLFVVETGGLFRLSVRLMQTFSKNKLYVHSHVLACSPPPRLHLQIRFTHLLFSLVWHVCHAPFPPCLSVCIPLLRSPFVMKCVG